jgi:phosphoribosylaminoimidazole-succinocarboxamide synthase
MTSGKVIRKKVSQNLDNVLEKIEIPELGKGTEGKVRHTFSTRDSRGERVLVMFTSDRVSAFDVVLDRAIPYKGSVLNAIAKWSFEQTKDIVPNALLSSPSPHIMIQKELTNIGFECIVRGYLWGSLAMDYEMGIREKCGIALEDGLLRYQNLEPPIFTPTTKARQGHDQDVPLGEVAELMQENLADQKIAVQGMGLAREVRDISFQLFQRGQELARRAGLFLIDTKYEFGVNQGGKLYLIDEVHTPDSSRFVESSNWKELWPVIREKMGSGSWANVSDMLQNHPELKVKELSKQVVRDILIERGYDPVSGGRATLRDEDIIETAARYIELYERLTGKEFDFEYYQFSQPEFKSSIGL